MPNRDSPYTQPHISPRTAVFSRLVRETADEKPLVCAPVTALRDVVGQLTGQRSSCIVVVDLEDRPLGILTEQDVTRRVAFRASVDQPVTDVMTAPVRTINEDEYLYYAVARMRRFDIRHMPVVDQTGRLTGMLSLEKAIADTSKQLMNEIDSLTREDSIGGLTEIKAAQVDLAAQLFIDDVPAPAVQALLTRINNDIYRRVINLNLAAMRDEGFGDPPVDFSVIVMGSGGRGENYLYPDQDNGFIIDDYPDDQHTEIDGWFIELADRMTRDMDRVGLPLCKGFVMATNPLWRKTRSQWKHQVEIWNRRRSTTILRLCDIFFDFRTAWGDVRMANELRRHVLATAGGNPTLLRDMYEDDREHGVALGWFGRFITESEDEDHLGEINLKHTGTLPLVEAMRLLCIREGIGAIPTLDRMAALNEKGVLDDDEYDYLSNAFRTISDLLLRQQIRDFKAGEDVTNYIDPAELTEREKDVLTSALKSIKALRDRMRSEFTGEIF